MFARFFDTGNLEQYILQKAAENGGIRDVDSSMTVCSCTQI